MIPILSYVAPKRCSSLIIDSVLYENSFKQLPILGHLDYAQFFY